MKKEKLIFYGMKAITGAEWIRDHAMQIGNYLSIVSVILMLGGAMFGVVRGQSEPFIDVNEIYTSGNEKSYVSNGDEGQNIQTLNESNTGAQAINLAGTIFGTDSYGPEAQQRAEELNLPPEVRGGLLGVVDTNVTALLYDPPNVSISQHLANQWIPGAESSSTAVLAQPSGNFSGDGPGYEFLSDFVGIEQIWGLFRNLAYGGFVIVIMVSGFMIMFRSRINGQTTVNIMNSLPGILVGLVMVTFSFAIAGFMIDMGRLFSAVLDNFMSNNLDNFQPRALSGPFRLAWYAFESTDPLNSFSLDAGVIGGGFLGRILTGIINTLIALIAAIVVGAIALYAGFRVFFMLVMTYIKIFIETILGPVYILLGSLPGKGTVRTDWLKRLIAAVLVFPVAFLIVNLGRYIGEVSAGSGFIGAIQYLGGGDAGQPLISLSGMFVIAAYFIAAGTPGIVNDIIAVQEGKGVAGAMQGAQKAAGKVPLIGGMFGG